MRGALVSLILLTALASPAFAQVPPASVGDHYVPAPWWMRDPVIASIGYVRVELPSNRANFTATFTAVDRTADAATAKALDSVRELSRALSVFGAEKVRVETTFSTRALYEQYRDKEGNLQENNRADKIERYEVDAQVTIEVRDTSLLEKTYASVLAAKPTSTGSVEFSLEPENETKTALYREAVKDASARAHLAAESAGAKLGSVKVIDPTGRACQTDVLAGWPSYGSAPQATTVARSAVAPHPGLTSVTPLTTVGSQDIKLQGVQNVEDLVNSLPQAFAETAVTLQPPLRELTAQACVVYGLAP